MGEEWSNINWKNMKFYRWSVLEELQNHIYLQLQEYNVLDKDQSGTDC